MEGFRKRHQKILLVLDCEDCIAATCALTEGHATVACGTRTRGYVRGALIPKSRRDPLTEAECFGSPVAGAAAAAELGISRATISRRTARLGIAAPK